MTEHIDKLAKFPIGLQVKHKKFGFRGVIFDVDPVFSNSEEWWEAIPEDVRPSKDQPYYHLLAVTQEEDNPYIAYVSEQNLVPDTSGDDISHPGMADFFDGWADGVHLMRQKLN